jgi:anti-sigma B factor antagonist
MNMKSQKNGTELTFSLGGRFDSITAPEVQSEMEAQLVDVTKLVLDFAAVTFLSSAGIRTVIWAEQQMKNRQGTMILRNVNDSLKKVFVTTGLDTALNFG